ncbi:MAG: hypothetical protein JWP40_1536, partial [Blastococcus sp.]|nr:hypothetical protein [Blastococcus sp.]
MPVSVGLPGSVDGAGAVVVVGAVDRPEWVAAPSVA